MDHKPRVAVRPLLHLGVLVRSVIIDDQVDLLVARCFLVDLFEEPQPLDMRVVRFGS